MPRLNLATMADKCQLVSRTALVVVLPFVAVLTFSQNIGASAQGSTSSPPSTWPGTIVDTESLLTTTTQSGAATTLLNVPVPTNESPGGKTPTTRQKGSAKVPKTTQPKSTKKVTTTSPSPTTATVIAAGAAAKESPAPSTPSGSGVDSSITTVLPADQVPNAVPESTWLALRKCESNNRYDINTGNGYYGAYQFAVGTWRKLGYSGYPHRAAPAVQDEAAKRLQAKAGWGQWPACSRKLGLR